MLSLPSRTLAAVVFTAALVSPLSAAPTPQQRAEMLALGTLLTKAGNLYKESQFKEAGALVKEIQSRLEKLLEGADPQLLGQLKETHSRLVRAHALLELEGIVLPELKPLPAPDAAPASAGGAGSVSFAKQVAPILNARCGNCHVRGARGMFSMATYEALMKGPPAGKVVFPGNVPGSDLIVKVEDKEMPPNGAGIPDAELATLKQWVQEGAKFDGPTPATPLASLTGNAPAAPALSAQPATGKETVSFAKDIAPVLAERCTGCHGMNNPRNNLSLISLASLLRGGDRGEPIAPGRPAGSLLVNKLKGTADGGRMPLDQQPLDAATIAKFETWITEGARFDGPNPNQPVAEVAALAKAKSSTHQELTVERARLAAENWRLGMPGADAQKFESTNFLVLGNVGENTLADIAQRAEAQAAKVADMLRAPRGQPLVKGRMTLFVFGERYDYGEFGKMAEKRDLPPAWRGHYRYSIVDAYGAVLVPRGTDYSLDALIAQSLASVYAASQGQAAPHWFAEGCGRVVASRLAPASDQRVGQWEEELPSALASLKAPDDFLTGKLSPEHADICSYSFVKFLMSETRRFNQLLDGLRKGGDFGSVFYQVFGGTPAQLSAAWARNPPKPTRRARS